MLREIHHPNAYLEGIKNTRLGLRARTGILNFLERSSTDARAISKETGMTYAVVMHHLKRLEAEDIVHRKQGRPFVWALTGVGQKRLANSS